MADIDKAIFRLSGLRVNTMNVEFISQEDITDLDMNKVDLKISVAFDNDEVNFAENKIIKIKIDISGFYYALQIKLIIFHEVEVDKADATLEKILDENHLEIAKPGLLKASTIFSDVVEDFIGFPEIVNFYEMYTEKEDSNEH